MPRYESDICILGGGISAAFLAEKLSELKPGLSITVVEAGKRLFDLENRMGYRRRSIVYGENQWPGDFIEDQQAVAPAEAAARALLNEAVGEALDELTDRERQVVRLRFGLEDGQARTLEEVGKEFGVTRERIRQIEAKTLAKLRHPIRSQRLRDYLDES